MAAFDEMHVRRRLLSKFIQLGPGLQLVLKRPQETRTESGGVSRSGNPLELPPQEFAYMPLKRRQTVERIYNPPSSGRDEATQVEGILIGQWDADVEKHDYFNWEGNEHLAEGEYVVDYVGARIHDRRSFGIIYRGP